MKYIHGIVVVNRFDLLAKAVASVHPLWPNAFILDNSPAGNVNRYRRWEIPVVRPSVPLSCAQSMNYLHRIAMESNADVWGYQHNDAMAKPGATEAYMKFVEKTYNERSKWGVVLTRYDIISAYNPVAVNEIGPWDWTMPNPNYHIDLDWFYRMKLKGYAGLKSGVDVEHMENGSQTIRSRVQNTIHHMTFTMNEEYYRLKWGGPPKQEVFTDPYNRPVIKCTEEIKQPQPPSSPPSVFEKASDL